MCFSKSFPLEIEGSNYPKWVEIEMTEQEADYAENECRKRNIQLLKKSIDDARRVFEQKKLKAFQTDVINAGIALFKKNASHTHFWKEEKAKEKFNKKYRS